MPGVPAGIPVTVPGRVAGALERAARRGHLARPVLSRAGPGQAPVAAMNRSMACLAHSARNNLGDAMGAAIVWPSTWQVGVLRICSS